MKCIFFLLSWMFLALCGLQSCSGRATFYDKDYYERSSGITIPADVTVIEDADNGEFVTITVFSMDSVTLNVFAEKNRFRPVSSATPFFWGQPLIKTPLPTYDSAAGLLYTSGMNQKWGWIYLVDKQRRLLFAEIQYPDHSGD